MDAFKSGFCTVTQFIWDILSIPVIYAFYMVFVLCLISFLILIAVAGGIAIGLTALYVFIDENLTR